jgi:hypothetical protein
MKHGPYQAGPLAFRTEVEADVQLFDFAKSGAREQSGACAMSFDSIRRNRPESRKEEQRRAR